MAYGCEYTDAPSLGHNDPERNTYPRATCKQFFHICIVLIRKYIIITQ